MHAADMGNSAWTLEVLDEGFCLRRYRQAAADPRYSILPPVLDELKIHPKYVPPLRVGVAKPGGLRVNALQDARLLTTSTTHIHASTQSG